MEELRIRLVGREKWLEFCGPRDITLETTGAIVNAANSSLMGGGGVDGAIHRAGGPRILDECKAHVARKGRLPAGQAMITEGGRLAAKHVIHTVGPIYHDGQHEEHAVLASCYRESLRIADQNHIDSLAFPSISTGAYGYPLDEAARIAVSTVLSALRNLEHVERVRFVLFDRASLQVYVRAARAAAQDRSRYEIESPSS
jgi:O-acetyl-ADP-ribose deacetylase